MRQHFSTAIHPWHHLFKYFPVTRTTLWYVRCHLARTPEFLRPYKARPIRVDQISQSTTNMCSLAYAARRASHRRCALEILLQTENRVSFSLSSGRKASEILLGQFLSLDTGRRHPREELLTFELIHPFCHRTRGDEKGKELITN